MSLHQDIKKQMQEAMKEKDKIRLSVLRGLVSAFTNELVSKKKKPSEELNDEEVMAVIQRAAKQRKDSIEQFSKGGRDDLAEKEATELKIIEEYLPTMMTREEIKVVASKIKTDLGIDNIDKLGMFMGAVMRELKGQADGNDVKAVVENLF